MLMGELLEHFKTSAPIPPKIPPITLPSQPGPPRPGSGLFAAPFLRTNNECHRQSFPDQRKSVHQAPCPRIVILLSARFDFASPLSFFSAFSDGTLVALLSY